MVQPELYVPELIDYLNREYGDEPSSLLSLKRRHLRYVGTYVGNGFVSHYWRFPGVLTMWLPSFLWGQRYAEVEVSQLGTCFSLAYVLPSPLSRAT
jgi:hypothetical protein